MTARRSTQQTDLGTELLCARCNEYWPADPEFFYKNKSASGYHSWCKACYLADDKVLAKRQRAVDKVKAGRTQATAEVCA